MEDLFPLLIRLFVRDNYEDYRKMEEEFEKYGTKIKEHKLDILTQGYLVRKYLEEKFDENDTITNYSSNRDSATDADQQVKKVDLQIAKKLLDLIEFERWTQTVSPDILKDLNVYIPDEYKENISDIEKESEIDAEVKEYDQYTAKFDEVAVDIGPFYDL